MAYTIHNKNFNALKEEFKKDTGLDSTTHIDTYIAYFNARSADLQAQLLAFMIQ